MRLTSMVLILAGGLAACGPAIRYERTPDRRIPAGARWAWAPADSDGYSAREGGLTAPDTIDRRIADAIEAELVAKGFPRTTPAMAEFLVHYHLARRARVDTLPPRDDQCPPGCVPRWNRWDRWGWYGSPEEIEARIVQWDEGTLIIDALAIGEDVVLWRGVISAEVPTTAARRAAPAIRDGVRRVLKGFP